MEGIDEKGIEIVEVEETPTGESEATEPTATQETPKPQPSEEFKGIQRALAQRDREVARIRSELEEERAARRQQEALTRRLDSLQDTIAGLLEAQARTGTLDPDAQTALQSTVTKLREERERGQRESAQSQWQKEANVVMKQISEMAEEAGVPLTHEGLRDVKAHFLEAVKTGDRESLLGSIGEARRQLATLGKTTSVVDPEQQKQEQEKRREAKRLDLGSSTGGGGGTLRLADFQKMSWREQQANLDKYTAAQKAGRLK